MSAPGIGECYGILSCTKHVRNRTVIAHTLLSPSAAAANIAITTGETDSHGSPPEY